MASRKLSPMLSGSTIKPRKADPAYTEALHVMSEETMTRVCNLLLSEDDYNDNDKNNAENGTDVREDSNKQTREEKNADTNHGDGGSSSSSNGNNKNNNDSSSNRKRTDRDQLLEIYHKCAEAAKVIDRQRIAPVVEKGLGNLPPPPLGASRATVSAKSSITAKGSSAMSASGSMMSLAGRRMPRNHLTSKPSKNKRMMVRQESDSSTEPKPPANSKKPRLIGTGSRTNNNSTSPPPGHRHVVDSGGGSGEGSIAPPPSVLNFLAKLNKEKTDNVEEKVKDREEKHQDVDIEDPSPSTNSRRNPTRTQPSRASRPA